MGEFFYFLDIYLAGRLFIFTKDKPLSPMSFTFLLLLQILGLMLLQVTPTTLYIIISIIAISVIHVQAEKHFPQLINEFRIIMLGVSVLVFATLFSESLNPGFHPALEQFLEGPLQKWTTLSPLLTTESLYHASIIIAGLFLVTSEVNYLIRSVFSKFSLLPFNPASSELDSRAYNAGRIIGFVERTMVFLFVLTNVYSGIGFILAAKGFTRFKELNDREFAEYMLIGTLLSTLFAICIGMLAAELIK